MKHKFFIGILSTILIFTPLFAACKKQSPPPPPTFYNSEAEEELSSVFDFDFFPFDKVDVTELTYNPDFVGFKFNCADFDDFAETLSQSLTDLGFVKDDSALSFSKNINYIVYTIAISSNENDFSLTISAHDYVNPLNPEVKELLNETFGFDFFPMESVQVIEIFNDESFTGFTFDCSNFNSLSETITENLTEQGFVKDVGALSFSKNIHYVVYTITLSTIESSYKLTISSCDYVNPLNTEVESLLSETFDFDFFPMEHAQTIEIYNDETFTGFEFDCLDESAFSAELSQNLLALGFEKSQDSLTFTKTFGLRVLTIDVAKVGDYFKFTYFYVKPLNEAAKNSLAELLGENSFPFDFVDVVEIAQSENFDGFSFECADINNFKILFNDCMVALGFSPTSNELEYSKMVERTRLTVRISENEGVFALTYSSEEIPLSDLEKFNARASEIFGFNFALPEDAAISGYSDDGTTIMFTIDNKSSNDMVNYFLNLLGENGINDDFGGLASFGFTSFQIGERTVTLMITQLTETSCYITLSVS